MASSADMNVQSDRCLSNGAVRHSIDFARALRANSVEDFAFAFPRLWGVFCPQPKPSNDIARFFRPVRLTSATSVTFAHMFFGSDPLKVVGSIVVLYSIFVMNDIGIGRFVKPADCHNAMNKPSPSGLKVAVWSVGNVARSEISKYLTAARNGVKVVEESIFGSVYKNAQHALFLLWGMVAGYGVIIRHAYQGVSSE